MIYEEADLKVEAMRAANQAVSIARGSALSHGHPIPASEVLAEAKRIYAWFTEGKDKRDAA